MRVLLEPPPASTRALASLEALLPAPRGEVKIVEVNDLLGSAADVLILWALLPSLPAEVPLPGWDAQQLARFTADHRQSDRILHALIIARHNGLVLPTGRAVVAADKAAAVEILERHGDRASRRYFLRQLRAMGTATTDEAARWRQVLPQDSAALFAENGCLARMLPEDAWPGTASWDTGSGSTFRVHVHVPRP